MKRPSSGTDFNFDDLDEFDWSIIQDGFEHSVQPYLKKTKLITLNNPIKIIRTGKCYSSVGFHISILAHRIFPGEEQC